MPDFTHVTGEMAIRFHRDSEWYVARCDGDVHVLRVQANSERAVELFHRLSSHLDAHVDIVIEHPRDGTAWHGAMRALPDVRESIGRLRWPLASYGGVELTLVTPDDQLTLMPTLELIIFSRRDVWRSRLDAEGVHARASAPPPVWQPGVVPWSPAPELSTALATVAERLALEPGA